MALDTTPDVLASIWAALSRPPPPAIRPLRGFDKAIEDDWITLLDLEDMILLADPRLDREGLRPDVFIAMLGLEPRAIYGRPESRFDEPFGFMSVSAAEAAAVLTLLERLGFAIDPGPMCTRLRSTLVDRKLLTFQELDVVFHHQSAGRTFPLTLDGGVHAWRGRNLQTLKTPQGYSATFATGDDGSALSLTFRAPRYRKRSEPTSVKCPKCGMTYVRGLPPDEKEHRTFHRLRMSALDPAPDRLFAVARARNPDAAPWVDARSARWKRDRMYRRSFAFKRELQYDFVQWQLEASHDPLAVGYLFADDANRLIGAAGFRPQENTKRPWCLDWIWLAPGHRRQGWLSKHWPALSARFGEFDIEPPVSAAMKAFLRGRGEGHLLPPITSQHPPLA